MEVMEHHDEILGSSGISGLNPLLIPDVIQAVMESSRLSVADLKICRLVCSDWLPPATAALSNKSKITIGGSSKLSQMMQFTETFSHGQLIPSKHFELIKKSVPYPGEDIYNFLTDFKPLFDWPGLEIKSLILFNGSYDYVDVNPFLNHLSAFLKKTGYLEHLSLECWKFKLSEHQNLDNEAIEKQSQIQSLALINCELSDNAANLMLVSFMKAFPDLISIDLSNPNSYHSRFHTNILSEALVSSVSWSNIKTLKIPELNSRVIDQLSRTDVKLKHFHADIVSTRSTSTAAWTSFLTQQNELESFSINRMDLMEYSGKGYLDYTFPRMEKLKRLHIRQNGLLCIRERDHIFETCPKLTELIVGRLPADMIITNHQITSLTFVNPYDWYLYSSWAEDLIRVLKEYVGLKYLTVSLTYQPDRDFVINSLPTIFPNLLELNISP